MIKKSKRIIVYILVAVLLASPLSYLPAHAYSPADDPAIRKNFPANDPTDCEDTSSTSYAYTDLNNSTQPGEGNPAGLVYPKLTAAKMADAINKYIKDKFPNSPFNGLGAKIVASAEAAGINPFLIVALAQKESSMGTNGSLSSGPAHNAFGRSASQRQRHIEVGGRLWYQWDSIAQSVDHTDPENKKDPASSGDIASYLAKTYPDQLENNDLRAFIEEYAPAADGNDVATYVSQAQKVINDLAKLAGVTNPGNGNAPGGNDGEEEENRDQAATDDATGQTIPPCESLDPEEEEEEEAEEDEGENNDEENNGEIGGDCQGGGSAAATAVCFAWSKYLGRGYQKKKPSYAKAISAAQKRGEYIGGCTGVDCGGFTTRAVRDSGADKSFNKSNCNTICQRSYMRSSSKWSRVGYVTSPSKLSPGDIAVSDSHTFMWVGTQAGHSTKIASASLCDRAPMAGVESIKNIEWFHLK